MTTSVRAFPFAKQAGPAGSDRRKKFVAAVAEEIIRFWSPLTWQEIMRNRRKNAVVPFPGIVAETMRRARETPSREKCYYILLELRDLP